MSKTNSGILETNLLCRESGWELSRDAMVTYFLAQVWVLESVLGLWREVLRKETIQVKTGANVNKTL